MKTAAVILLLLGVALYSAHAKNCKGKDMKVEVVSAVLSPEHDDVKAKGNATFPSTYVTVTPRPSYFLPGRFRKTQVKKKTRTPRWREEFKIPKGKARRGSSKVAFMVWKQSKSSRNHMLMDCVTGLKSGFRWCQKLGVKLYYKIKC